VRVPWVVFDLVVIGILFIVEIGFFEAVGIGLARRIGEIKRERGL
jgi:hypothetical protein